MNSSQCLICGSILTVRAHLIPRCFTKEIQYGGVPHAVVQSSGDSFRASNTGLYDPSILCSECDGQLGANENYAYQLLGQLRTGSANHLDKFFHARDFDGDRFIRFCAGIAWKYSVTSKANGKITLGPYQQTCRGIAFNNSSIPHSVNAFLIRLHSGDSDTYFYRAPFWARHNGLNFVRFSVSGFVAFLKLDKRREKDELGWMRGKTEIAFPVLPMTLFEEGKKFIEHRTKNDRLRYFLTSMEARAHERSKGRSNK